MLPLLDECLRRAEAVGDEELQQRVASLLAFTHQFDRGVGAVTRTDSTALAHLFGVLSRIDDQSLQRLLTTLAGVPEEELARALANVARLRPSMARASSAWPVGLASPACCHGDRAPTSPFGEPSE